MRGTEHARREGPTAWREARRLRRLDLGTRGQIEASDPEFLTTPLPSNAIQLPESNDHMGNVFDRIKRASPPICEAEIGRRLPSRVISLRAGRGLQWDSQAEQAWAMPKPTAGSLGTSQAGEI